MQHIGLLQYRRQGRDMYIFVCAVGSVRVRVCVSDGPSVCLWALSCLNRLAFDLNFCIRVDFDLG